jgi:hypothetical protein
MPRVPAPGLPAASDHQIAVAAWFRRVATEHSVESLLEAFEGAFAALWQRSHPTLGDVTLTAIVERVLYIATEQFPLLASLSIDASGLDCQALRSRAGLPYEQSGEAIRFVLVEFLTVLGDLTAEILTPALHAELSRHRAGRSGADREEPTP